MFNDMPNYVVGVDGCRGGWLAIQYEPAAGKLQGRVHARFEELLTCHTDAACIAVDIPIGLTDDGQPRTCDLQARRLLAPKRSSSVFPAPDRRLLRASSYPEALAFSRQLIGKGIPKQAFAIYPKISEVDKLLTPVLQQRIVEVHPEVCFWALGGRRAMSHRKSTREGFDERRELLVRALDGVRIPSFEEAKIEFLPAKPDDVLDAIAAAWTADRFARGCSERIPVNPPLDPRGLRMEMVF